jgi:hypothetical protein
MKSPRTTTSPQQKAVTRRWLERTPMRVLEFVRTVSMTPGIRVMLEVYGYSRATHDEAWSLLQQACGYNEGPPVGRTDERSRKAIIALDDCDEDLFRLTRASLGRHHPDQARFVLEALAPDTGIAAVLAVAHLLDRLDALESSPARAATRAADHAALATLSARTITPEYRAELRALVNIAQTATESRAPSATPTPDATAALPEAQRIAAAREAALLALRAWHEEWSDVARTCIKRRDHLVRLGLATRRAHVSD